MFKLKMFKHYLFFVVGRNVFKTVETETALCMYESKCLLSGTLLLHVVIARHILN